MTDQEKKQRTITSLEERLRSLNTKQARAQKKLQIAEAKEREEREKLKCALTERIAAVSYTFNSTFDESISGINSRIDQYRVQEQQKSLRMSC